MEQQPIAVAVDQSAFMIYALGDPITIIDAGSGDILKELDLLCLFLILWGHVGVLQATNKIDGSEKGDKCESRINIEHSRSVDINVRNAEINTIFKTFWTRRKTSIDLFCH